LQHARIFHAHAVRLVSGLGKLLFLPRHQLSIITLCHRRIKPRLTFRIELAQLRARLLKCDQVAELDITGSADRTRNSQVHRLQWLISSKMTTLLMFTGQPAFSSIR